MDPMNPKREPGIIRELKGWISMAGTPCLSLMIELQGGKCIGSTSVFRQSFGPFCGLDGTSLFKKGLARLGIDPLRASSLDKKCFVLRSFSNHGSIIDGIEVDGQRLTWMEIARAIQPPGVPFIGPFETRSATLKSRIEQLERELESARSELADLSKDYTDWENGCERQN